MGLRTAAHGAFLKFSLLQWDSENLRVEPTVIPHDRWYKYVIIITPTAKARPRGVPSRFASTPVTPPPSPPGRRFEAHFETCRARRPQVAHAISENAVAGSPQQSTSGAIMPRSMD